MLTINSFVRFGEMVVAWVWGFLNEIQFCVGDSEVRSNPRVVN